MLKRTAGLWAIAVCSAALMSGQQIALDFDARSTKIDWILPGNVHTTHGTFQLKQGHVEVDAATGEVSGELVVEAESGESGNGARDKRMRKEILETDKYPEVRLKVTKIAGALPLENASSVRVRGQLTIHGTSHEVDVPLQVVFSGKEFKGSGKFTVPYVDWGLKDPSSFLFKVSKTVEVDVVAAGHVRR